MKISKAVKHKFVVYVFDDFFIFGFKITCGCLQTPVKQYGSVAVHCVYNLKVFKLKKKMTLYSVSPIVLQRPKRMYRIRMIVRNKIIRYSHFRDGSSPPPSY